MVECYHAYPARCVWLAVVAITPVQVYDLSKLAMDEPRTQRIIKLSGWYFPPSSHFLRLGASAAPGRWTVTRKIGSCRYDDNLAQQGIRDCRQL